MMSSAPAKSAGDARYASQDPFILNQRCPIQSRFQSLLAVRPFYVERNKVTMKGYAFEGALQKITNSKNLANLQYHKINPQHLLVTAAWIRFWFCVYVPGFWS